MEAMMTQQQLLEIKTDMKLLLECIDYQKDSPSALKQALITLSSILQGSGEAKDAFRDTGGLQHILDVVTSTKHAEVTEAGLYCLGSAVERNVFSQKLLSTASMFTFLHSILSAHKDLSVKKKQTATYLLLCLVSNNGFGQNLARQSSCLHDVISLIRVSLPKNLKDLAKQDKVFIDDLEEDKDGTSVDLWTALVSAICVCVNNPINENNQRICASLLPYLFSVLQRQDTSRIIRPVLSLVGLTVANNVQNQDRVRKCGGMEVFMKKLEWLLNEDLEDVNNKYTAIQLLNTLDSCIADNEVNSKKFGDLGGIQCIMKMFHLSPSCLDDHDKMQAVLTLAHAVDAYDANQKYIVDNGCMTVLIQQLTQTEDEELSKTIKYLLHMCVSSDKVKHAEVAENAFSDSETLLTEMEKMKRQSDMVMLQKISELDKKLQTMEKSADRKQSLEQRVDNLSIDVSSETDVIPDPHSKVDSLHGMYKNTVHAPVPSGESFTEVYQQNCPTPREKSLLDQLIKEKVERQRLEKENQILQEDICMNQEILAGSTDLQVTRLQHNLYDRQRLSRSCTNQYHKPQPIASTSNIAPHRSSLTRRGSNYTDVNNQFYINDAPCQNVSSTENGNNINNDNANINQTETLDSCRSAGYEITNFQESYSRSRPQTMGQLHIVSNSVKNISHSGKTGNAPQSVVHSSISSEGPVLPNKIVNLNHPEHRFSSENNNSNDEIVYRAIPLDLSRTSCHSCNDDSYLNDLSGYKSCAGQLSDTTIKERLPSKSSGDCPRDSGRTENASKNVEIQCGTPYVFSMEKKKQAENEEKESKTLTFEQGIFYKNKVKSADNVNESSENLFDKEEFRIPKQHSTPTDKSEKKRLLVSNEQAVFASKRNDIPMIGKESPSSQIPVVVLSDIIKQKEIATLPPSVKRSSDTTQQNIQSHKACAETASKNEKKNKIPLTCHVSDNQKVSTNITAAINSPSSSTKFRKPETVPPRKKIRTTPSLGSNQMPKVCNKLIKSCSKLEKCHSESDEILYDSDIQSEFDLELIGKSKQNSCHKVMHTGLPLNNKYSNSNSNTTPYVVKSQNNVRQIDKQVQSRAKNAADNWYVMPPGTPRQQSIVPLRPAFSDCGSRRPILDAIYSIKSVGRSRALDDSGINSPNGILNISSDSSSIDSNIDGFRSSSDLSDIEEKSPNITAAVLRSNKKADYHVQEKCHGCQSSYKLGGPLLNSRTYNILLETDSNTCLYHRKLRQIERLHISKLKKKVKQQMQGVRLLGRNETRRVINKKTKTTSNIYDFSSDCNTENEVSPSLSDENLDPDMCAVPRQSKRRRKRVPYTECEEANLREGVEKMGRHWNQILLTYSFHPSRTNVDLKDKYKRMMATCCEGKSSMRSISQATRTFKPFSMCEERRLRRGIKLYGYSWTAILEAFTFSKGRTTEDLRNKWRSLHRRK